MFALRALWQRWSTCHDLISLKSSKKHQIMAFVSSPSTKFVFLDFDGTLTREDTTAIVFGSFLASLKQKHMAEEKLLRWQQFSSAYSSKWRNSCSQALSAPSSLSSKIESLDSFELDSIRGAYFRLRAPNASLLIFTPSQILKPQGYFLV